MKEVWMYECKVHLQKQGVLHIFTSVVFDSLTLTLYDILYLSLMERKFTDSTGRLFSKHCSSQVKFERLHVLGESI